MTRMLARWLWLTVSPCGVMPVSAADAPHRMHTPDLAS